MREAIVNAVAHADYSRRGAPIRIAIYEDRLEVENPGLLQFGLTVDDQRMVAACRESGLAERVLEEIGTRFRVTILTSPAHAVSVDDTDRAILDALATGEGRSTQQIAAAVKLSARVTRTWLLTLVGRGFVREVGTSPQDPSRRYLLAAEADSSRARTKERR